MIGVLHIVLLVISLVYFLSYMFYKYEKSRNISITGNYKIIQKKDYGMYSLMYEIKDRDELKWQEAYRTISKKDVFEMLVLFNEKYTMGFFDNLDYNKFPVYWCKSEKDWMEEEITSTDFIEIDNKREKI